MKIIPKSMVGRLLVLIVLISLLPAAFVGWISYAALYDNIKENKIRSVGSVAESKHQHLRLVLSQASDRIAQFLEINQNRCGTIFRLGSENYAHCLQSALITFVKREDALGAIIHRQNASDLSAGTHPPVSSGGWSLQPGQLAIFPVSKNRHERVFHIPVSDSQTRSLIVVTYPVGTLQEIFSISSELGDSGETFLADANGYFITSPRYSSKQGHGIPISATPMQHCLKQHNMQMLELDYRAVPIIHGFQYIPETGGGCIMAHVEQQEAFAPLQELERKALLIAIGIVLIILLSAFYMNRLITRPLTDLCKTLAEIQEGRETVTFSDRGPTEIVSLTGSFTAMIKRLRGLIESQYVTMGELRVTNAKLEEAQSHLLQSEKMASIGQLAAGVAHEINNPIGFVYSNLNTLEKYVQDSFGMIDLYEQAESAITDPEVHARLTAAKVKLDIIFLKEDLRALMDESKDGITRVKNIVQNLKDFSHADTSDEWRYFNLHSGIDSTLNIVNNEIKYKADVVKDYGTIPDVECLPSQLNQVFMNLLVNASHAIEEHGTITVRTGQQGDEVWIEVADTGKGITSENMKKIFDPFFTTKPIGKGTGLGLSLSYGVIKKHQGRIEVQSEVGKGTTFRVWLPVKHLQGDPITVDLNSGEKHE
jgi:signal transduction histidine kinase